MSSVKNTHDVDDLRESESDADGQRVRGVADRSYQLVVAAVAQFVVVQALRVRLRPQETTVAPTQCRHQHHCRGE